MQQIPATIERFLEDQSGASALEYGLLAALVSLVMMWPLTQVGESVQSLYFGVAELITEVTKG